MSLTITMPNKLLIFVALPALTLLSGCFEQEPPAKPKTTVLPTYTYALPIAKPKPLAQALFIVKQGTEIGIDFIHETGAAGKKLMPETMGPGCALFDYDQDGLLDAMVADGHPWTASSSIGDATTTIKAKPVVRLYRNAGEKFTDVTLESGLATITGYGMGLAIADYDADNDADVLVTTITGSRLLRNDQGKFVDVTTAAGLQLATPEWATSAAWLDVDYDGWLDLFIANYVQWSPETDVFTTIDGTNKSYATPTVYQGLDNRLFRNLGNGQFVDISATAGMVSGDNKALGVVVTDANDDWLADIFVSNDTVANKLYLNDGKGNFTDGAMLVGVGYDELGQARAGMGVDTGESINGNQAIVVGNFSDEPISLYERTHNGNVFIDAAQKRGVATKTMSRLTFGSRFADFNQDGYDDLILVNGHIEPDIQKVQTAVTYQEPIDVFLAQTNGRLESLADLTGTPIGKPIVGRSLAIGDLDNDGDLDVLVTINGGNPVLLYNNTCAKSAGTIVNNRYLSFDLHDPESNNRQALGAYVTLSGKDWSRRQMVRARGSYLGHSPYTLHFGIPPTAGDAIEVTVRWPNGVIAKAGTAQVGNRYRVVRPASLLKI